VLNSEALPTALILVLQACDTMLVTAPRWFSRALGATASATCVAAAARPHAHSRPSGVAGWAIVASLFFELHGDALWLLTIAPSLLSILGRFGEVLVFSLHTLPLLRLLFTSVAAWLGVVRGARPLSSSPPPRGNAGSHDAVRWRRAPLLLLATLHLGGSGLYTIQRPHCLESAREFHQLLSGGQWRQGFAFAAEAFRSFSFKPSPPRPPLSPKDAEERACRTLGVRLGTSWADVKKAYRALALEHHPDKLRVRLGREPSEAELAETVEKFKAVQEAHDLLEGLYNRAAPSQGPPRDEL
jgi:hypothetical protein